MTTQQDPRIARIITEVCHWHNIRRGEFRCTRGPGAFRCAPARHEACRRLRAEGFGWSEIARAIGVGHAAVMYACQALRTQVLEANRRGPQAPKPRRSREFHERAEARGKRADR